MLLLLRRSQSDSSYFSFIRNACDNENQVILDVQINCHFRTLMEKSLEGEQKSGKKNFIKMREKGLKCAQFFLLFYFFLINIQPIFFCTAAHPLNSFCYLLRLTSNWHDSISDFYLFKFSSFGFFSFSLLMLLCCCCLLLCLSPEY